jgi:hypothetical protein
MKIKVGPGFDLRAGHVVFVVHKVVLGRFLLLILIPPVAPHSLIILSCALCSLAADGTVT